VSLKQVPALERKNLALDVAARLRESIVDGTLPPGTRLLEVEAARQLGVSRGPLREALRILEAEGLIISEPGHGSHVTQISERDIREIYSLRRILEEEAFRLAAQRATEAQLQQLDEILEAMFDAAGRGDPDTVLDLDLDFHKQVWRMSGHSRLEAYLNEVAAQARIYIAVQTSLYDDLAAGISDHREMLAALRERDPERAIRSLLGHLQEATDVLLDYFDGREHQDGA
jgi:DNA-binding GntR family transcriptional regulator